VPSARNPQPRYATVPATSRNQIPAKAEAAGLAKTFQTQDRRNVGSACRDSRNQPAAGRRIYVHQHALRFLATADEGLCGRLCASLADVRATKMIHHQTEMALELGLISRRLAEELNQLFGWGQLTDLFREIIYRPAFPKRPAQAIALLGPDEQIIASCSEAGYYTFATGDLAAERMFADHEPIPSLQRSLSAGAGPHDLTMLRGRCLARLDPSIGTGLVGRLYNAQIGRTVLSDEAVEQIDRDARSSCEMRLSAEVAHRAACCTPDERSVMNDILTCLASSFETLSTI
jgi:hypothetical protein